MTEPVSATPTGSGNPAFILTSQAAPWLTESPDSKRLLGPRWNPSGITISGVCQVFAGDCWRSGIVTASGADWATIRTSDGVARCSDRRNLLVGEEAVLFKRETAAFRRLLKKRQEGGQSNG